MSRSTSWGTPKQLFSSAQWISWAGALIAAVVAVTVFTFQTFETRAGAAENKADVVTRLEHIEAKLDRLIERGQ
jgi:uncharacterized membrane protein